MPGKWGLGSHMSKRRVPGTKVNGRTEGANLLLHHECCGNYLHAAK